MIKRFFFFCFLTFAVICVSAQDYRDVVFLKNGSVIKGFYRELYPSDTLRMETIDGGIFVCAMSDVVRIAKERTSLYVVNIQDEASMPKRVWRPRGYRGFLEYGQDTSIKDSRLKTTLLLTAHGYQFNRHIFLGGGFAAESIEYTSNSFRLSFSKRAFPVFACGQLNILSTQISPFIDCRAGYTLNVIQGLYLNPAIGVDFGITPRTGGYLSIGYLLHKYHDEENNTPSRYEALSIHVGLHF